MVNTYYLWLIMADSINKLSWDSLFFSKNIGMLDIKSGNIDTESLNAFDLVQAKVSTSDYEKIVILNKLGFEVVEGEVLFCKELDLTREHTQWKNSKASDQHIDNLVKLAAGSFDKTRFRPPWFELKDSSRLYKEWTVKAVEGTFDDVCLYTSCGEIVTGFVTIRVIKNKAIIGLISVNPLFRGKKIGSKLFLLAESYALSRNASTLHVATQLSNISALRLYSALHCKIFSTNYWFYR